MLGLNYVIKGKLEARLSAFVRTMEQLREKADYNCVYDITKDEVVEMKQPSREIVALVQNMVS